MAQSVLSTDKYWSNLLRPHKTILCTLLGVLLHIALAPTIHAAEGSDKQAGFLTATELSARGFRPLFAGEDKSLANWDASETHARHWTVRDGVLHYDGKNENLKGIASSLWTKDSFGDTEFYVEWKLPSTPVLKPHPIVLWNGDFLRDESGQRITRMHQDAGDSGILFRGVLKCQANIWSQELGSGEVNGYRTNKKLPIRLRQSCLPFAVGDNPLGQWNAFLVTLKNDRLSVQLNGQPVLETEPLPDLPARGPIGLQHHGDPVQFRNIWVKEIKSNE
jgi:hypothetical protein